MTTQQLPKAKKPKRFDSLDQLVEETRAECRRIVRERIGARGSWTDADERHLQIRIGILPNEEYTLNQKRHDDAVRIFGNLQRAMLEASRAAAEGRLPWPWLQRLIAERIDPMIRLEEFLIAYNGIDPLVHSRPFWEPQKRPDLTSRAWLVLEYDRSPMLWWRDTRKGPATRDLSILSVLAGNFPEPAARTRIGAFRRGKLKAPTVNDALNMEDRNIAEARKAFTGYMPGPRGRPRKAER